MATSSIIYHPSSKKGQSLLEVIVALAAAMLVILGLVRVTIVSMRNSRFAKNQALATQYAQEAMEWIRTQRDEDWAFLVEGDYCLNALSWTTGTCGYELGNGLFKRKAVLTVDGDEKFQIAVTVSWDSGAHQSKLSSYLTKW